MGEIAKRERMNQALQEMLATLPDHALSSVCRDMSFAEGVNLGANESGDQTPAGHEIYKLLIRSGYMVTYEKVGEQLRFLEKMALHY
jgi:hypothetical protein